MKIRTGIDIIEVNRIKEAIDEMGDTFLNRIFTEEEIQYSNKFRLTKYEHFAARFAVKEAMFKAISEYALNKEESLWKNIEVINEKSGKPCVNVEKLTEIIKNNADNMQIKDVDISISHIKDYAIANVVVVFDN